MKSPLRHSSGAVRGLVLAFGISAVGFGTLEPFLVLWGRGHAGLAGSAAGLLFVAQALGEVCGGLAAGIWADRVGGRETLLVSTAGMAAGYGSLAFVSGPALALGLIFVAGLFEAAYHPTALALLGQLTAPERRAEAYGVIRAVASLGTIVGPIAGAAIIAGVSVTGVFVLCAGLLVAAGVVVATTLPARGPQVSLHEEAEEIQAAVPCVKAIAVDRRLRLLVVGGGLLAITLAWWEADGLAVLHTQRAFGATQFSLVLALSAAITVVFQIPVSRATRGRPVNRLLAGGAALQALGLASLAAAPSGLGIVVGGVALTAVGQMLYGPHLSALVNEIAPAGRETSYQAAMSTTNDIGMAGGPASGLALSAAIGAGPMWALSLPLGLLAGLASSRAVGRSAAGGGERPGRLPAPTAEIDHELSGGSTSAVEARTGTATSP